MSWSWEGRSATTLSGQMAQVRIAAGPDPPPPPPPRLRDRAARITLITPVLVPSTRACWHADPRVSDWPLMDWQYPVGISLACAPPLPHHHRQSDTHSEHLSLRGVTQGPSPSTEVRAGEYPVHRLPPKCIYLCSSPVCCWRCIKVDGLVGFWRADMLFGLFSRGTPLAMRYSRCQAHAQCDSKNITGGTVHTE